MSNLATQQDMILGSHDELQRMARRIKLMVKGGERLSDSEAMALAQIAHVTQLNPFIGEVWYIPGKGPMIGIAGARRHDNEMTAKKGGYSWPIHTVVAPEEAGATPEEIKAGVAAAYKVEINDSTATEQYQKLLTETIETLRKAETKDPFAEAKEICGNRPVWTGYGYSTRKETSRMNKQALAMKRAEADALKKRIVIPFGGDISTNDVAPSYVDVDAEGVDLEFVDLDAEEQAVAQQSEEQIVAELTGEKA